MIKTVLIHLDNELLEIDNTVLSSDNKNFNSLTIRQKYQDFSIIIPNGKENEFVDAICKAFYDTSYSELTAEVDILSMAIDSKNDEIEELKEALEPSEEYSDSTELY